jgi:hypothetical protein
MATTKSRATFDLRNARPFYAYVGATDLAVETLRDYLADVQKTVTGVQKDVSKTVADLDAKALREQAVTVVTARVESLQKDAKARRVEVEKRLAELRKDAEGLPARVQKNVDANVAVLADAYGDLVKRGQSLVGRIRRQAATQEAVKDARTTVSKAKATRTSATKAAQATPVRETAKKATKKAATTAKKRTATTRSNAKATVTAAKKTAQATAKAVTDAAEKVGD